MRKVLAGKPSGKRLSGRPQKTRMDTVNRTFTRTDPTYTISSKSVRNHWREIGGIVKAANDPNGLFRDVEEEDFSF